MQYFNLTSHVKMELYDSSSELARLEEEDEVGQIITNIGR